MPSVIVNMLSFFFNGLRLWVVALLLLALAIRVDAQELTYKEAREILLQAENTASEFENLLNAISNTNSGRDEIQLFSQGSFSPGPNQIFLNKDVVIEDNLNPTHVRAGDAQDKTIAAYLSDFDISYTKSDDPSVKFDKRKMGPIRRQDILFVNFLYENSFGSTSKGMAEPFRPTQRVLTIRAEKSGNKWKTLIAGARFATASDSLTTPPPDLVAIQKTPEQAAKMGAAGVDPSKDVFSEIMQEEARREYAERRQDREKAYNEAILDGDKNLAAEKYDEAVEAFERAIAINSYDYRARARLQEVVRTRERIRSMEAKKTQDLEDLLAEATRVQDYPVAKGAAEQLIRRNTANTALQDQLRQLEVRINELDQARAQTKQMDATAAVKFWDKEYNRAEKAKETPQRLADLHVERALASYRKSDFKRTFIDLNEALKVNPVHRPALLAFAQVHLKTNEPYKALNDYTLIITNSRFSPGFYKERAAIKLQVKDTAGAVADYNQAIGLDPNEPDLYFGRAMLMMLKADFAAASADLGKASVLDPKASRYPFHQGMAFLAAGDVPKASDAFGLARKNNPTSDELKNMAGQAWAKYEVGSTQTRLGEYNAALATFSDALSLNPELVEAYLEKGVVLMKMLDFTAADECFSKALEARRNYTPVRVARSTARLALKNTEGALQDCMTALQTEAQNYLATIALAQVYIAQDRQQDAMVQFKKAQTIYPDQPNAYLEQGRALTKMGQTRKAEEPLERALRNSKNNEAHALLAMAENTLRAHDYKDAIKLADKSTKSGLVLQQAMLVKGYATALGGDGKTGLSIILAVADKDPDQYYPLALIYGAEVYLMQGQASRAKQQLDKLKPARRAFLGPVFYTTLGNILMATDSVAEAKQAYSKALSLDETYSPCRYGLARCAARNRESDVALRLLKESLISTPFPKEYVEQDPSFTGLKDDKRFKSLLRDVY